MNDHPKLFISITIYLVVFTQYNTNYVTRVKLHVKSTL